ncbi:hypothetical protein HPB47_024511 [Ixodes persulcatus]|uniref:Uncharacterized protein n=1 Tax=Ixodes persulcatus TaxID=34615 RepID=A0AC60Q4P0_IXOPE|nr:hypothetical protein HPB47_024511 [Ixodes persulcatus]
MPPSQERSVPLCGGYFAELVGPTRARYVKKLELCDGEDPYELCVGVDTTADAGVFPNITHGDIVNYLVFSVSYATLQEMKAFKSLESHNYFTSGWVKGPSARGMSGDRTLSLSEVNHSQRLRETPAKVWILVHGDGSIITAHCTCMAGAGEACSHIGATLFAVETIVRIRDSSTCTQKENRWLPAYTSTVEYKRLREIDFSSARSKKKRLQGCGEEEVAASMRLPIPEPSEDELRRLYDVCSAAERKPAVPMMVEGRNNVFPPPQAREPSTLRGIFTQEAFSDTLDKLIERADAFFASFSVSAAMVKFAEATTRAQSKCPKWYTYRAGRITASTMKSVCSTSVEKPSLSVLKRICYPEDNKFSTPATRLGLDHEEEAVQSYVGKLKSAHANFTHRRAGLSKRAGVGLELRILGSAALAFAPRALSWCALAHSATDPTH